MTNTEKAREYYKQKNEYIKQKKEFEKMMRDNQGLCQGMFNNKKFEDVEV